MPDYSNTIRNLESKIKRHRAAIHDAELQLEYFDTLQKQQEGLFKTPLTPRTNTKT